MSDGYEFNSGDDEMLAQSAFAVAIVGIASLCFEGNRIMAVCFAEKAVQQLKEAHNAMSEAKKEE